MEVLTLWINILYARAAQTRIRTVTYSICYIVLTFKIELETNSKMYSG